MFMLLFNDAYAYKEIDRSLSHLTKLEKKSRVS